MVKADPLLSLRLKVVYSLDSKLCMTGHVLCLLMGSFQELLDLSAHVPREQRFFARRSERVGLPVFDQLLGLDS